MCTFLFLIALEVKSLEAKSTLAFFSVLNNVYLMPATFNLWQNSKTQIVTKLKKHILSQNSNLNYDKTQKLKFWLNSNTQIVTKLKTSNCDITKKNSRYENYQQQQQKIARIVLHLQNWWDLLRAAFCDLAMFSVW